MAFQGRKAAGRLPVGAPAACPPPSVPPRLLPCRRVGRWGMAPAGFAGLGFVLAAGRAGRRADGPVVRIDGDAPVTQGLAEGARKRHAFALGRCLPCRCSAFRYGFTGKIPTPVAWSTTPATWPSWSARAATR